VIAYLYYFATVSQCKACLLSKLGCQLCLFAKVLLSCFNVLLIVIAGLCIGGGLLLSVAALLAIYGGGSLQRDGGSLQRDGGKLQLSDGTY
jgi:hypothetical protein